MTFIEAGKNLFCKRLTMKGRASRSEFWWTMLWISLIGLIFTFIAILCYAVFSLEVASNIDIMLGYAIQGFSTVYSIAYGARRLHDINKSAWWLLLYITIIGVIVLIVFYVLKGTEGKNRFGEDPLVQNIQNPTVA